MRQNWLSNRIVNPLCYAWNNLIDPPWKIMLIGRRDLAAAAHSI
jgi:hypothetical protein